MKASRVLFIILFSLFAANTVSFANHASLNSDAGCEAEYSGRHASINCFHDGDTRQFPIPPDETSPVIGVPDIASQGPLNGIGSNAVLSFRELLFSHATSILKNAFSIPPKGLLFMRLFQSVITPNAP